MVAEPWIINPFSKSWKKSKSIKDQDKERKKRISEIDEFFDQAIAYQTLKSIQEIKTFLQVPSWEAMIPVIEGKTPLMIHANESGKSKQPFNGLKKEISNLLYPMPEMLGSMPIG